MRKLGMWGGPVLAVLLAAGLTGLSAGPGRAQDRAQDRAVPWLGVMTQSLDDGLREGMDYRGNGVLVSQVVDESPASRAGIRKGDVIISVNSRGVESPEELSDVIRSSRSGQNVSIVVWHEGRRRSINARLGERPDRLDQPEGDMDELRDLPRKMDHDMGDMHDDMGEMRWQGDEMGPGVMTFRGMRGRLGIRVQDLNEDLGTYFDVPRGKGALVVEVLDDTPAKKAGLRAGDVITEVGGHEVSSSNDLVDALRDRPKGNVSIAYIRKGARRTVEAELEDAPGFRFGPGHDMTIIRPRGPMGPEVERRDLRRGRDSGDTEELRQLREEVRQLREKLNRLQDEDQKDQNDQDRDQGHDHD